MGRQAGAGRLDGTLQRGPDLPYAFLAECALPCGGCRAHGPHSWLALSGGTVGVAADRGSSGPVPRSGPLETSAGAFMITTREDLIQALGTAAELEHSVCCMYLFAAFTLKRTPEEGVSWEQAESGRSWMATLLGVAREEMGHLGTVLNLLAAVGGAPHLWHPSFPSAGPFASPD